MPKPPCVGSVSFPELVCEEACKRYTWRGDNPDTEFLPRERHDCFVDFGGFPGRHPRTEVRQHFGFPEPEVLKFGVVAEVALMLRDD